MPSIWSRWVAARSAGTGRTISGLQPPGRLRRMSSRCRCAGTAVGNCFLASPPPEDNVTACRAHSARISNAANLDSIRRRKRDRTTALGVRCEFPKPAPLPFGGRGHSLQSLTHPVQEMELAFHEQFPELLLDWPLQSVSMRQSKTAFGLLLQLQLVGDSCRPHWKASGHRRPQRAMPRRVTPVTGRLSLRQSQLKHFAHRRRTPH